MAITYHFTAPAEGEKQVDVVFLIDDAPVHRRKVNAQFVNGVFSDTGTEHLVHAVANGVINKLDAGAIEPMSADTYTMEDAVSWAASATARAAARAQRLADETPSPAIQ